MQDEVYCEQEKEKSIAFLKILRPCRYYYYLPLSGISKLLTLVSASDGHAKLTTTGSYRGRLVVVPHKAQTVTRPSIDLTPRLLNFGDVTVTGALHCIPVCRFLIL